MLLLIKNENEGKEEEEEENFQNFFEIWGYV